MKTCDSCKHAEKIVEAVNFVNKDLMKDNRRLRDVLKTIAEYGDRPLSQVADVCHKASQALEVDGDKG